MNEFLIGQRVICEGEIALCIHPPYKHSRPNDSTTQWLKFPLRGENFYQWHGTVNIKPLPNGQL